MLLSVVILCCTSCRKRQGQKSVHAIMLKWYLIIEFMLFIRGCYFQEGEKVRMEMSVETAYGRSIETLIDWLHTEVNMSKTRVFFRTYAPVHFRFLSLSLSLCLFFKISAWVLFFFHEHFKIYPEVTLSRIFQLPDLSWMLICLYVLFWFLVSSFRTE
jgi:hypothetical protein